MHQGSTTNTVLYIPVGPKCPINDLYCARMRFLFEQGLGPPDFNKKPDNELHYKSRASKEDLSQDGLKMFGY